MVPYQKTNFGQSMPRPRNLIPAYTLHKKSGLARCTWQGDTVYLGKFNSPESISAYNQVLSLFNLTGKIRQENKCVSVAELITQFLAYLKVTNEVKPREIKNMAFALRWVEKLFGNLPANEFKASQLVMVRDKMIEGDLSRSTIVKYQRFIVRCWRWGVRSDLVPGAVVDSLRALETLKKRRSAAREPEKVKPVTWEAVEAVKEHVASRIWAMILLQWYTGMRPGEVIQIRPVDIDRTGAVWFYRPPQHKTDWRDKERVVGIGQQGQAVLMPWLDRPADMPCFSPAEDREERFAVMRSLRKTKVQPSQVNRKKKTPAQTPGDIYKVSSYQRAIKRACEKIGIEPWAPNQLRHTFATRARKEFGLDAAQVALGHEHADVTQVYAEKDIGLIRDVAERLG
jgi:integrase